MRTTLAAQGEATVSRDGNHIYLMESRLSIRLEKNSSSGQGEQDGFRSSQSGR